MAEFTSEQIREKYLADLRAAAVAAREVFPDEPPEEQVWSPYEQLLERVTPVWTCSNHCVWIFGDALFADTITFLGSSDTLWAQPMVTVHEGKLAVEIVLVDWYDPENQAGVAQR